MEDDPAADSWRAHATVDDTKMTGYLLSMAHPYGRSKAAFFARFGFTADNAPAFRDALLAHVASATLVEEEETAFGRKFVVEGAMRALEGDAPLVRSVWFEEPDQRAVKLVTAYPATGEGR